MTSPATLLSQSEDAISIWRSRRRLFSPPVQYKQHRRVPRRPLYYVSHRGTLSEPPRSRTKRLFDVTSATCALIILSPLLAAIGIAIKLTSPGPIFFTQNRYGHLNQRFRIYKFRTMHVHLGDAFGVKQTIANDPRVTSIGRFLRRTSLDELPQLINVVTGDMSLVGPRPHVPGMQAASTLYENLVPYYFQRHTIKPGITGLAQVSGCRGSTASADQAISRVDYDLDYIERWSLWLDVKIIWWTIRHELLSARAD
ncbi:MAG: exopolysaccharide biosynthesis polyprenyl glycosylphosphotransferase [Rhizobiales bacterium]|nr:exopolysaccharide biosynthesis polyprenyl glycosylphosphotransferase [Hyphomicrobiales bacterium]OJY44904.1 MAG: exopolysaccharide biosynthesis protein [Rhizobiales bacterium 64-17]